MKSPSLLEAAEEVVAEFDALVNENLAFYGMTYDTERLCKFREMFIQRLRVAAAMAARGIDV